MKFREIKCFKAYDVRGIIGQSFDDDIVYRVSRSLAQYLDAKKVVIGFDARETSKSFAKIASQGVMDSGSDVLEIGMAGTEEMYCAVNQFSACAGIEVTASHNPLEYNGLKMVKYGASPLDNEVELSKIKELAENGTWLDGKKGEYKNTSHLARSNYVKKVLSFVDLAFSKSLKVVINCGNGAAGPTLSEITKKLSLINSRIIFYEFLNEPDPSFPNGIPNPLLKENQELTGSLVRQKKADFGVAFDGDFDRCFFFDKLGNFVPGEYIVGLLAESFLFSDNDATVIYDPRVIWNTEDIIRNNSGNGLLSRTGHSNFKASMRKWDAIYGGEMSAHHYFRDFYYCDSGMIAFLLILDFLGKSDRTLEEIINERIAKFPSSGEINFEVADPDKVIASMIARFSSVAAIDKIDGVSFTFENWRFNIRKSNTEPLIRLNVESKKSHKIVKTRLKMISNLIKEFNE